jgi:prevent-host-death family protein
MSMLIASSALKARLGHYLRLVRRGKAIVITDRDEPIARLSPLEAVDSDATFLPLRPRNPASLPLGKIAIRPIKARGLSTLELLAETRRR